MRQYIIKILLFIVTFIISIKVISTIMNMGNTDMTVEMSEASLPTVTMLVDEYEVNTLYGYVHDMKANYLRDTLTPLPEDRKLYAKIKLWGSEVSNISYEVRSLDTTRLVENTQVYDYIKQDDEITVDFPIKDLIDKKQEYILITILEMADGRKVKYYTRVIEDNDLNVREQLKFCYDFHEKTFDKEAAKSLVTYLESNEEGDNSSFDYVNIHSSFNQVTWGDLKIDDVYDMDMRLLYLDSSIASIMFNYYVDINDGDNKEKYRVSEYFRIRYTDERTYLLNYERTMDQIFNPDNEVFINDKVILGITNEDVQMKENTDGSIIVFVKQNTLYEYMNQEGKLARLFSFYDGDNMDIRTLNKDHNIRILNMDEGGNVTFMVYGYMNRGRHEGQVGASVYYFNNAQNSIEEQIFILYDKSAKLLNQDIKELAYVNRKNQLYIYMSGNIYCINLEDNSTNKIATGLTGDDIVTSKSNEMVAWGDNSGGIKLLDLNTNFDREIKLENAGIAHALGFVGEDFVYGISKLSDVFKDSTGVVITPMHSIIIENESGKLLKEYSPENIYITSARIDDSTIQMTRIKRDGTSGSYYIVDDDQIMNNVSDESTKNSIKKVTTETREAIAEISLTGNVANSIHLQAPKEVLVEGERVIAMETNDEGYYYVYSKGDICGLFKKGYAAINVAYAEDGVVVDDSQEYIWEKGSKAIRSEISRIEPVMLDENYSSLAACLDTILNYEGNPKECQELLNEGETAMTILQDNIDGNVLELTGCNFSAVLYYVNKGIPVLGTVDGRQSVLVVGYDEKNAIIMDPNTGSTYKKGMNDTTEMFIRCGNEFITYVRSKK